jgi:hypothetical protein
MIHGMLHAQRTKEVQRRSSSHLVPGAWLPQLPACNTRAGGATAAWRLRFTLLLLQLPPRPHCGNAAATHQVCGMGIMMYTVAGGPSWYRHTAHSCSQGGAGAALCTTRPMDAGLASSYRARCLQRYATGRASGASPGRHPLLCASLVIQLSWGERTMLCQRPSQPPRYLWPGMLEGLVPPALEHCCQHCRTIAGVHSHGTQKYCAA